jgi:hypothetical protein
VPSPVFKIGVGQFCCPGQVRFLCASATFYLFLSHFRNGRSCVAPRWPQLIRLGHCGALIEQSYGLVLGVRRQVAVPLGHPDGRVPALPESTSAYNLVNAITGAARQAEPARRLEIESLAGTVLGRHVGRA